MRTVGGQEDVVDEVRVGPREGMGLGCNPEDGISRGGSIPPHPTRPRAVQEAIRTLARYMVVKEGVAPREVLQRRRQAALAVNMLLGHWRKE